MTGDDVVRAKRAGVRFYSELTKMGAVTHAVFGVFNEWVFVKGDPATAQQRALAELLSAIAYQDASNATLRAALETRDV